MGYSIFSMVSDYMILTNMICPDGTKTDKQAAMMKKSGLSHEKVRDTQRLGLLARVADKHGTVNSEGVWVDEFAKMLGDSYNNHFLRKRAYKKLERKEMDQSGPMVQDRYRL